VRYLRVKIYHYECRWPAVQKQIYMINVYKARYVGKVENHGKNGKKNTAHFCENRKNHGSLYSCYFAKTHGFQLQKNIFYVKYILTFASK